MAMKIGAGINLDGESDFKKAVSNINSDLKVLSSEMKKVTSEFIDNETSMESLAAKDVVLSKQLETQKDKIEAVKKALESSKIQYGENDNKTKAWQTTLNNAESDLNKLSSEIKQNKTAMENQGTEAAQTSDKVDKFARETDNAADKTDKLSDKLKTASGHLGSGMASAAKVATVGVAAMAAAAVAATAAVGKLFSEAVEAADGIQKTADVYGMTAERVQELTYVGTKLDVELDTMTKGQTLLTKNMLLAEKGTSAQAEAFKKLGVSAFDSNGNMRDSKTVMAETITALGNMKNETERDALSMKLFGKSAMELNPLIKAGGAEIARLTEEARKSGAVMSNEAVKGLDDFGDTVAGLKASIKGIAGSFATSLLPAMNGFTDFAKSLLPVLQDALKTGDFGKVGDILGDGLRKAINSISFGIQKMLPVVVGIITDIVNAIVVAIPQILPVLIKSVLALVNAFIGILKDNGPMLIKAGMDAIMTLIDGLVEALPALIDMAITLIMALANGLVANLPKIMDAAVKILFAMIDAWLELLPELIPVAIKAIVTLAQGLVDALPKLITKLPQIISTIVKVLVDNLPLLIDAAIKIIVALNTALIKNLPLLIKATIQIMAALGAGLISAIGQALTIVPKLFTALKDAFLKIKWGDLGKNIIAGIIDGIVGAAKGIADAVVKAAKTALDAVKGFLGIKSPSTVMELQVGNMMGEGMAKGIINSKNMLSKAMGSVANVVTQFPKMESAGLSSGSTIINIEVGTLVGTNGMEEFADIMSRKMAKNFKLSTGGAY